MTPLHRVPPALLIGLALVAPATSAGHAAAAAGVPCAARVAVLGADLTPAGRVAVRQTLGLGPGEAALTESLADERAQAHGLIPPALLGVVAVSSVALRPAPAGSGLRVTLDRNVTLYPAQAYANALLTAGVSDAAVSIAAPATQQALGTTALLGLLRAARLSCGTSTQPRQDLAVREFLLTRTLAASSGGAPAALLMARLKSDAAAGHVTAPGALTTLIAADAARLGTAVPPALRPDIALFLGDLASSHVYDTIAAAGPRFGGAPPLQAAVTFARPLGRTVPVAPTAASPTGMVFHGTASAGASATALAVQQADGLRFYQPGPAVAVFRDGTPRPLNAIQRGDTVTVTTDAAGRVTRIDAVSHGGAGAGAVIQGTLPVAATGSALAVRQGAGMRTYRAAPGVQIFRDGQPSTLAALRPNDHVALTANGAGDVTRIDATSRPGSGSGAVHHGIAAAGIVVGAVGVTVREGAGTRTYRAAPAAQVFRDGAPSTLGAIRQGDTVVVTTNGAGQATRIDATSHAGTPGRATTGGVARGMVAAAAAAEAGVLVVKEANGTHTYRPTPGLQVSRDGAPSSLAALRPSDSVTVHYDATGAATRIDATSHAAGAHGGLYHGTVAAAVAAGASALAVKEAGGTRTYRVAPGAPVYRDGQPSALGDLKATDTITGTTDAAGVTTRLDATRAPVPAVVASPGVNPALIGLGALAALLLLLLPFLRRRRRRPTIVTTTTTATGAAVIPTLERPASEPLRARLHDGKDLIK